MTKFSANQNHGQPASPRGTAAGGALLAGIEAVFLDLFDTLVEVDQSRLPTMSFRGARVRSTAPIVFEEVRELVPGLDFDRFFLEYSHITEQFWEEKNRGDIELTAPVRMQRVLRHFRAVPEEHVESQAERLARIHMESFMNTVRPIDGAIDVLENLAGRDLPLALVSNFDYAPAVHDLLDRLQLGGYFRSRIISAEVGLRKPNPGIFDSALRALDVTADVTLHIGDDPRADAWGAGRLGMRTVWIDRKGTGFPEPEHYPDRLIARIDELGDSLPD